MYKEFCALIMAGGKGTRFWPKSTEEKPKQFLSLVEERTMLQMTIDRVKRIIPIEKIFVVTCSKYVALVKEQIVDLPERNIIVEPIGRNTAPCILLASLYIKQLYENPNIAVFPSDHIINEEDEFCKVLNEANQFLNQNVNAIVTIGIKPDRPETAYGYIKATKSINEISNNQVVKVERFEEKPNIERAQKYLESKEYFWNAGMFVFNINYILKELEKNFNNTYKLLKQLPNIFDKHYNEVLNTIYIQSENISIDYAVMEKSESVYVIPSEIGWDDIGNWQSLQRYITSDKHNNVVKGDVKICNSKNNIVYAENKKVVLLNIEDIFCLETENTIVIGHKKSISEVYKIKEKV